uniref:Uncharacterized protein n=1 Tax=Globisporangium ultimum (strain ATCC 200006 / CBS 805.95 / DAOM BR144) TaxID=431595 RepID=K3W7R7_GLOUD
MKPEGAFARNERLRRNPSNGGRHQRIIVLAVRAAPHRDFEQLQERISLSRPQLASIASASGLLAPNDSSGNSDHSSTTNSHSSTVSPPPIDQNQPSQQVHPRPQQLQVQQTNPSHPYRNILTHQERKKLRMPKRKADAWPASILTDPDVLSLDDEGRFVLCKVCHVHYAVHGGKKPKPVIMNSGFRTRAWDVHKERTNSHRMQKKHSHLYRNHDLSQQQQHSGDDRDIDDEDKQKDEECKPSVTLDAKQKTSQSQQGGSLKPSPPPSAQRDGMMRWRNMHDDVSRALGGSISSKRPASDQYTNGDLRISNGNTMMLGETEEFGGSSEDSTKTVVVHDQALVNAIDRLTGIVSKQMSDRYAGESNSSATVTALTHLTTAVTELRVQQDHALGRIIELQEQRFHVMEAILQHKLRKEAVRNQGNGSNGAS